MSPITHPQPSEDGNPVQINVPSKPTAPETWTDSSAIALFVPGGVTPTDLHGIPFVPWLEHPSNDAGWHLVGGQMEALDEPVLNTKGKKPAAGAVIEEPDGRVWVVRPTNGFGGYMATFPKGRVDDGIPLQATAIRECLEEAGLKVVITGFIGDVERSQTMTRYYRAKRVGGTPTAMSWESQACVLVPKANLHGYLNQDVDRKVAVLAGIVAM